MNIYTDDQLKAALAKMLPEHIEIVHNKLRWRCVPAQSYCIVLDTELLHLCWMVEETLNKQFTHNISERNRYVYYLQTECGELGCAHATWQQRTVALAKVKGVEIV